MISTILGYLIIIINIIYFIALYKAAKQIDKDLYFLDFITSSWTYENLAYRLLRDKTFYLNHLSVYTRLVRYLFLPSHLIVLLYLISLLV